MEEHNSNLMSSCRICGSKADRNYIKSQFINEIRAVYGIDISKDDPLVHPNKLCSKHRRYIGHFEKAKSEGKPYSSKAPLEVIEFSMHNDECVLCHKANQDEQVISKKQKAKRPAGPGRSKRHCTMVGTSSDILDATNDTENSIDSYEQINSSHEKESTVMQSNFQGLSSVERGCLFKDFFSKLDADDLRGLSSSEKVDMIQKVLNAMTVEEKCEAAKLFGSHIRAEIEADPALSASHDMNVLKGFNVKDIAKDNSILMSLISGIASKSKNIQVMMVVIKELIQRMVKATFIGPFSFLYNLVGYSIHSSKLTTNILGSIYPAGKYQSVLNWLTRLSTKAIECPEGDVIFSFDNEQMVAKTWSVVPDNKSAVSVVTNVCGAIVNKATTVTNDESLHPKNWFTTERNENVILSMTEPAQSNSHKEEMVEMHYEQLYIGLSHCIQKVEADLSSKNGIFQDHLDEKILERQLQTQYKVCPLCQLLYPRLKRVCQTCKDNLVIPGSGEGARQDESNNTQKEVKQKKTIRKVTFVPDAGNSVSGTLHTKDMMQKHNALTEETYGYVPHNHPTDPPKVLLFDPVNVNPNSYENIKKVLRHIGKVAGVKRYGGTKREFEVVCMDGLPYSMVIHLAKNYISCGVCHMGFMSTGELNQHAQSRHNGENISTYREFNWVVPKCGDGHYEMNLFKSFFELNWNVTMSQLCHLMGWKTDKAQKAAKACSDNHKTWQLLLTFYFGTLMELVRPYVLNCKQENRAATPEGFISYAKQRHDPNFRYMFEMTLRYCQGIINLRVGIRRNNSKLIQSAKHMTKELFHGRVHPRYQDLEIIDTFIRKVMPDKLKTFMSEHDSMSRYGNPSNGQGYDFILEELNRIVKKWIRNNKPTFQMWVNVCRNCDSLQELQKNLLETIGIEGESNTGGKKQLNLNAAIEQWRMAIREKSYFSMNSHLHTSLSGDFLDSGLVDFTDISNRKRDYRILELLLPDTASGQAFPDHTLKHPVYVTPAERTKFNEITAQTIEVIDSTILHEISKLNETTRKFYMDQFELIVRGKQKKENHLEILYRVMEAIESQTDETLMEEESGEE